MNEAQERANTLDMHQTASSSSSNTTADILGPLYEKLNKNRSEIRLLVLQAREMDAPLELMLLPVALDDKPEFWALSYVWGDASVREEIQVNGHLISITANLFSALRHIEDSLQTGDEDQLLLWADAICINQDDTVERNEQVQMMRSIYQQASVTVAWLGEGTSKELPGMTALAILGSALEDLRENSEPDLVSWLEEFPDLCEKQYDAQIQEIIGSSTGNILWDGIEQLLKNPYWTRTWTLQEVVLPETLVLMCGSFTISEIDLMLFLDWHASICNRPPAKPRCVDPWIWIWISTAGFLVDKNVKLSMSLRKNSVLGLKFLHNHAVLFTRKLQATEPRDKVYGVLGISDSDFPIDYSKSVRDIYCEFAESWLREDHQLNLLSYAGIGLLPHYENPNNVPSWTPDWQSISHEEGSFFELYDHSNLSVADGSGDHSSSEQSFTLQEGILRAHGVLFDEVDTTTNCPEPEGLSRFCLEVLEKLNGISTTYQTGIPPLQAIFRVLLADKADPGRPGQRTGIVPGTESFLGFVVAFLNMLVQASGVHDPVAWEKLAEEHLFGLGIEVDQGFAESLQKHFFGSGEELPPSWWGMAAWDIVNHSEELATSQFYSSQFLTTVYAAIKRQVFITTKGYLGLGPPGMQSTDLVCALLDCKYPVVLRKYESHFLLVGVCFVLGLMDGEALKEKENGGLGLEELEIR